MFSENVTFEWFEHPYVCQLGGVGEAHRKLNFHLLLSPYLLASTLWVDHQLYFPQALVRIECV